MGFGTLPGQLSNEKQHFFAIYVTLLMETTEHVYKFEKKKGESAVLKTAVLSRECHNLIMFLPCEQLIRGETYISRYGLPS